MSKTFLASSEEMISPLKHAKVPLTIPAIPQCTARSKRFVFRNDTHVKRSVCCLEMGLDLVGAVTTRHNDFITISEGRERDHVLKQGLVENREQWLGYGVGPRPEP